MLHEDGGELPGGGAGPVAEGGGCADDLVEVAGDDDTPVPAPALLPEFAAEGEVLPGGRRSAEGLLPGTSFEDPPGDRGTR
ncbi:hypothetical protein [Amycolatopsis sp. NPDC049159]|uniref:hypothetical protein n=1 Tax=unclassified Amycolatopsis TaxID=2618356 RepID=UPI0034001B5F